MQPSDPFSITDKLDEATLGVVAGRLEVRARNPRFVAMLDGYLDAMQIDRAQRVIDLGCGTGVAARTIARRPGFAGSVLGIDLSPGLVAAAVAPRGGGGDRCRASPSAPATAAGWTWPTPAATPSWRTRWSAMSTIRRR